MAIQSKAQDIQGFVHLNRYPQLSQMSRLKRSSTRLFDGQHIRTGQMENILAIEEQGRHDNKTTSSVLKTGQTPRNP